MGINNELIVMALEDEYIYALTNNKLDSYPKEWDFTSEKLSAMMNSDYQVKESTKPFYDKIIEKYCMGETRV